MSSEVSSVRLKASNLNYIDSSGVASLLFARKLATRFNAIFIFESVSEGVARVINLASLGSVLGLPPANNITDQFKIGANSLSGVDAKAPEFSDSDALAIFQSESPTLEVDRKIKNTQLNIKAGTFS
jgi:hypothetical protein